MFTAERDALLHPALARGMKKGVDILQNGEDGRGIRVSNNAPWYREFYAAHGRAPRKDELMELAYLLTVGDVSAPKVEGWMPSSQEAADAMEAARGQLDELNAHIGTLSNIKDRMMQLDAAEVRATQGLTPEAYGVYHAVMAKLREIGGVQAQAARLNALLFAARADAVARVMREKGGRPDYTARDYFDAFVLRDGGRGETGGGFAQKEIQSQKEAVRKQYEGTAQWMKAPNGKATNLTEDQWLTVRTSAFKAWFGDWEAANALEFALHGDPVTSLTGQEFQPDGVKLTDKVPLWYKAHFNGVASNPELGEVKLDLEGVKDSMGHGMGREKAAAYAAVPYIIEHGIVYDRQMNWKQRGYDTAVIIAPIKFAGQDYIGEVVVKRQPNRQGFYLHEVEIQKKLESAFKTPTKGGAPQASRLIIADHLEKVKDCSKVVDENGEPLVVYHGSDAKFDVFDKTKGRSGMDIQGMFFSPWKEDAQGYGGNVRAFFLNIKNPANEGRGYKALNRYQGQNYAGIKAREDLTAEGYDGVNNSDEEFIAFEPNQIKSVDNNGAFSFDDMNIFHQSAWHGSPQDAVSSEMAAVRKRYEGTPQWMMAPNGKPTNLTEEEWLAVRTPAFKAAFGDWEQVAAAAIPKIRVQNVQEAKDVLRALGNKPLKNEATGVVASVSKRGRGKLISSGARRLSEENGYTAEEHLLVAANVEQLFPHAVLSETHADRSGELVSVKLFSALVLLGKKPAIACFTVKETTNAGHKIYSVQMLELKKSAGTLPRSAVKRSSASADLSKISIAELADQFNPLFGRLDENGEPLPSVLSSRLAQAQQRAIYGEFSKENGKKIITLFAGANPSTMLHEMGHMFLDDLDALAQFDEASAKDLATVNEWAEWHEGAAKEYADTPWAQEFREHEKAIRAALTSGDAIALRAARSRWRHERFARGFELYLYEGKAPSKALRGVFRRFKQLLRRIYQFVKDVGGKPSPEVEAVMARMIASEEEIKAAELDERWRPVDRLGGKEALDDLLGENVADTYAKWLEEAREDAEDILRARVMKDLRKEARKEFKARVEAERERKRVQLENEPVYLAEAAIRAQMAAMRLWMRSRGRWRRSAETQRWRLWAGGCGLFLKIRPTKTMIRRYNLV